MTNTEKYLGKSGIYAGDGRMYSVIEIDADGNCTLESPFNQGVRHITNVSQVRFPGMR